MDPAKVADEIDSAIRDLPVRSVVPMREVRRRYSRRFRNEPPRDMMELAFKLVERQRWIAYELLYAHPGALATLDETTVERLGEGMDSWDDVDTFGRYISGPAWQKGRISDETVMKWTASTDLFWRRAALVSTVPLNLRAAGGMGDTARTLAICDALKTDRADLVVKALSWALRSLVLWDREAVEGFVAQNGAVLAGRVKREVACKLRTGLKNSRRGPIS